MLVVVGTRIIPAALSSTAMLVSCWGVNLEAINSFPNELRGSLLELIKKQHVFWRIYSSTNIT